MFDVLPFHFDVSYREVIILAIIILALYLILLIIPGVGSVIRHITHTFVKYIIHPLIKYVFEAMAIWFLKMCWWFIKYLLFAFRVYFYNLSRSHISIYPALNKKQIGVITDE
ncbi:MAG: hypothetical protein K2Y14_01115 [Burkholderiales bacterium]|nr:hypothetical protein [Burkholderiales bacterium]